MEESETASEMLVTGAGSGIGRATAQHLVREGHTVVGLDSDSKSLDLVAAELGNRFHGYTTDVSSDSGTSEVFAKIEARFREIRGLVNAAGVGSEHGDIVSTTPDQWMRTVQINLTGVFLVSRRAVPLIARAGGGSIVHIASQLGLVGTRNSPDYSASKGGVIALGRSMALDHAHQGIRVNVVCPGPIDTPLYRSSSKPSPSLAERVPWGRIGRPEEVAALVGFLLSDSAEYMTGSVITIDGGWTAQ